MSNSLNKVQIIGNLTADPEVRETPNGQKVATFSVATNRKWKDASGILQEEVEYHNCVAWRGLADILEQYTSKGKKVYIEWYLKTRSWDDTAGVKRYKTEIVSENVILLTSPGGSRPETTTETENEFPDDDFQKAEKAKKAATPTKTRAKAEESISIEDIPF
jgi:single-strand DNA-binding protein